MSSRVNLDAIASYKTKVDSLSRGNFTTTFNASKIVGHQKIRLLPPLPCQNGNPFYTVIEYWINGVGLTSPLTIGEKCPIDSEVKRLNSNPTTPKEIKALLEKKPFGFKGPKLEQRTSFNVPILLIDNNDNVEGARIFNFGKMVLDELLLLSSHPTYGLSLFDRVDGFNVVISRIDNGGKISFRAVADRTPTTYPEDYYQDSEIPDVVENALSKIKHPEYLLAVLNNFLRGTPIPEGLEKSRYRDVMDFSSNEPQEAPQVRQQPVQTASAAPTQPRVAASVAKQPEPVKSRISATTSDDDDIPF